MRYISTRPTPHGTAAPLPGFCDILLEGLAPGGGLYLPAFFPKVTAERLEQWRKLSFPKLATAIFSLYIDDIPQRDIDHLTHGVFTKERFESDDVTPLRLLGAYDSKEVYVQNLSMGPTAAFKDVGLSMLAAFFEYELERRGGQLNILGATSGDTGSAAIYAMLGKKNIRVFMMSPQGRMSEFQKAQMYGVRDPNIFNLVVDGNFDDAQRIVKEVSADEEFKKTYSIGAVNSINWARIMTQIVYYFWGYFRATEDVTEKVSFSVPSGNFGNVCAGHIARIMGLPIRRLVVATNENDVLHQFFSTGTYTVRSGDKVLATSSPSMDIGSASNFERFIFSLLARNQTATARLFGSDIPQKGGFTILGGNFHRIKEQYGIVSWASTHTERLWAIKQVYDHHQDFIDPHTADAFLGVSALCGDGVSEKVIVLETALPVKFEDTMKEALGFTPPVPPKFEGVLNQNQLITFMTTNVDLVKEFIKAHT
jgi:threonine synthase